MGMGAIMDGWGVEGETPEEIKEVPDDWDPVVRLYYERLLMEPDAVPCVREVESERSKLTNEMIIYRLLKQPPDDPIPDDDGESLYEECLATQIGVREVDVTEEMLFAGSDVILDAQSSPGAMPPNQMASAIYRAMHALAPVPLVSDGELAALRERDKLQAAYDGLGKTIGRLMADRDAWSAQCAGLVTERDEVGASFRTFALDAVICEGQLMDQITSLRLELAAAHDFLAQQRIAVKTDTPKPVPNPFREHRSDPRRLGLA